MGAKETAGNGTQTLFAKFDLTGINPKEA